MHRSPVYQHKKTAEDLGHSVTRNLRLTGTLQVHTDVTAFFHVASQTPFCRLLLP